MFIRCGYLPAMRTGLYATPNPAAIKRSILTGLAAQAPSFKTGVSRHFFD